MCELAHYQRELPTGHAPIESEYDTVRPTIFWMNKNFSITCLVQNSLVVFTYFPHGLRVSVTSAWSHQTSMFRTLAPSSMNLRRYPTTHPLNNQPNWESQPRSIPVGRVTLCYLQGGSWQFSVTLGCSLLFSLPMNFLMHRDLFALFPHSLMEYQCRFHPLSGNRNQQYFPCHWNTFLRMCGLVERSNFTVVHNGHNGGRIGKHKPRERDGSLPKGTYNDSSPNFCTIGFVSSF